MLLVILSLHFHLSSRLQFFFLHGAEQKKISLKFFKQIKSSWAVSHSSISAGVCSAPKDFLSVVRLNIHIYRRGWNSLCCYLLASSLSLQRLHQGKESLVEAVKEKILLCELFKGWSRLRFHHIVQTRVCNINDAGGYFPPYLRQQSSCTSCCFHRKPKIWVHDRTLLRNQAIWSVFIRSKGSVALCCCCNNDEDTDFLLSFGQT